MCRIYVRERTHSLFQVAAKELGMIAFEDRNFLVASIPDHRRDIHLKKYEPCVSPSITN